ncbi:ornithine carbamoyltransferase [Alphaproteobacteria bacterium]|nr:ornithine carbamoyltransferase [Alphaproteobacteria bacterium]
MKKRNFINLSDINKKDLNRILRRAKSLKNLRTKGKPIKKTLERNNLAMIFEKPSTRTRVSFELAIKELGGNAIILDENTTHLARGETIADTARVLERYCHIFMVRTNKHSKLLDYDKYSKVPIVNGLSNISHPCQILADIMTYEENRGAIKNKTITWLGDLNNVLYSWAEAADIFQFYLNIAHPKEVKNKKIIHSITSKNIRFFTKPLEASKDSDCVITDTWFSMGSKKNIDLEREFLPYQVNKKIFKVAHKKAVFMHCLPAERKKEVTGDIIDDKNVSLVWDEAENRLHIQKAILEWCLHKI